MDNFSKTSKLSELSLKPKAVLVHDPTKFHAFNHLKSLQNKQIQEKFLFRELPDTNQFHEDHKDFVEKLKQEVNTVLYISEILASNSNKLENNGLNDNLYANPNQVYTRDALITLPWVPDGYIAGNMGKEIRHQEPEVMSCVADLIGLKPIVNIPDELILEGGDVIPFCHNQRKYLLIGYGRRTTKETLFFLQSELVKNGIIDGIIGIELAEWRINLDGGMVPVAEDLIIAHLQSLVDGIFLDKNSVQTVNPIHFFKDLGFKFIEVSQEESLYKQSCNCFCLGGRKILAYDLSPRVLTLLKQADVEVIKVRGQELVKGTGGPRCMTRPIYKDIAEEAKK